MMAEMGITDTNNINSENILFAEAWKHQPPYNPKTPRELGAVKWRAQCQCGKVSYLVKRDRPLNVKICHCRNCQVMHGAPFQLAAIFEKEDLAFIPGSGDLSFYSASNNSQDYDLPCKVSCSFCHSPIFDEGRKMVLLMPELIQIEGTPEEQRKQREVFKPL